MNKCLTLVHLISREVENFFDELWEDRSSDSKFSRWR